MPADGWRACRFGTEGSLGQRVMAVDKSDRIISPWHDIPLYDTHCLAHMVCTSPAGTWAKFEPAAREDYTPIRLAHDPEIGEPSSRFADNCPWNQGIFPKTWQDPKERPAEEAFPDAAGDARPLEVIDISQQSGDRQVGDVYSVKLLGAVATMSGDVAAWKIIAIAGEDRLGDGLESLNDVETKFPGFIPRLRKWLRLRECHVVTADGSRRLSALSDPLPSDRALMLVAQANASWQLYLDSYVQADPWEVPVDVFSPMGEQLLQRIWRQQIAKKKQEERQVDEEEVEEVGTPPVVDEDQVVVSIRAPEGYVMPSSVDFDASTSSSHATGFVKRGGARLSSIFRRGGRGGVGGKPPAGGLPPLQDKCPVPRAGGGIPKGPPPAATAAGGGVGADGGKKGGSMRMSQRQMQSLSIEERGTGGGGGTGGSGKSSGSFKLPSMLGGVGAGAGLRRYASDNLSDLVDDYHASCNAGSNEEERQQQAEKEETVPGLAKYLLTDSSSSPWLRRSSSPPSSSDSSSNSSFSSTSSSGSSASLSPTPTSFSKYPAPAANVIHSGPLPLSRFEGGTSRGDYSHRAPALSPLSSPPLAVTSPENSVSTYRRIPTSVSSEGSGTASFSKSGTPSPTTPSSKPPLTSILKKRSMSFSGDVPLVSEKPQSDGAIRLQSSGREHQGPSLSDTGGRHSYREQSTKGATGRVGFARSQSAGRRVRFNEEVDAIIFDEVMASVQENKLKLQEETEKRQGVGHKELVAFHLSLNLAMDGEGPVLPSPRQITF